MSNISDLQGFRVQRAVDEIAEEFANALSSAEKKLQDLMNQHSAFQTPMGRQRITELRTLHVASEIDKLLGTMKGCEIRWKSTNHNCDKYIRVSFDGVLFTIYQFSESFHEFPRPAKYRDHYRRLNAKTFFQGQLYFSGMWPESAAIESGQMQYAILSFGKLHGQLAAGVGVPHPEEDRWVRFWSISDLIIPAESAPENIPDNAFPEIVVAAEESEDDD